MPTIFPNRVVLWAALLFSPLCAAAAGPWPVHADRAWSDDGRRLQVQYLQVGSVLIRYGEHYLLSDPFYSNSSLWQLLTLRRLQTDTAAVERFIDDWQGIRGVLIGHGHYDHVLDVPYVVDKTPATTPLYGSQTVMNMLAAAVPEARRQPLAVSGKLLQADWIDVPDSPFRIRAILSEHAPHLGDYKFAAGGVDEPMASLPDDVLDWREGQTLSYLIDVVDPATGTPRFRVFLQTSASNPPKGFPPDDVLAEKAVDLAIICAANFTNVSDYPDALLRRLQPGAVMAAHYEPFWKPVNPDAAEVVPGLDMDVFLKRVRDNTPASTRVYLPLSKSVVKIDND